MSQKPPPAGWVVQVTVAAEPSAPHPTVRWIGPVILKAPSFQYYNVAVAAPDEAVEATRVRVDKLGAPTGEMRVVRGLSLAEFAALSLKAGDVKPA